MSDQNKPICHDCPIGGRDGSGPICARTDECDRECEEDLRVFDEERVRYRRELRWHAFRRNAFMFALGFFTALAITRWMP